MARADLVRLLVVTTSLLLAGCDTSFPVPPAATCTAATCEAGSVCDDSSGKPLCSCAKGTRSPTNDGRGCVDIDECAEDKSPCDPNATCTNAPGTFSCTCKVGYTGNGASCADVDECTVGNGGCNQHATCANTIGSRTCTCIKGWVGSGLQCADVDECQTDNGGCSADALCTNLPGSRSCACKPGFKGDGLSCADINECLVNNGGCDALSPCNNNPGGYTCGNCPAGFTGGTNGAACVDINECTAGVSNCSADATCGNVPGSFTCTCKTGWEGNGVTCTDSNACILYPCNPGFTCADLAAPAPNDATGRSCTDVDECLSNNGGCDANAACTNTPGGRTCSCKSGFLGSGLSCTDINECLNSNGGCDASATCSNTPGSRTCACNTGYAGDGLSCADIDECLTANGGCATTATCTNTSGSRTCACKPGFTGNGLTCADVDECLVSNGGCDRNALCTNTPGSRTCACKTGFAGDGITCADVNECLTANGGCATDASCVNTVGGRTCSCNPGYAGDGLTCADVDACVNNPCAAGETCTDKPVPAPDSAIGRTCVTTPTSCKAVRAANATAPDGLYSIDADGPGPGASYQVYCDMTLDGGGWTGFFANKNGAANVFDHFETTALNCPSPSTKCLRRLPAALPATSQILAVCGAAAVRFNVDAVVMSLLRDGTSGNGTWEANTNLTSIAGGANATFASFFWTGDVPSTNSSWILNQSPGIASLSSTFASSYNSGANFDYCNGVADTTSQVRLLYREP